MNRYKIKIGIFAILMFLLSACSEKILDKIPLDKYSDATVWSDINLASSFLSNCFRAANVRTFGYEVMKGAVSDEMFYARGLSSVPYCVGAISADNTNGSYMTNWYADSNWDQFSNIQNINKFLANIDKVADAYKESEKAGIKVKIDGLKGEALFIRAWLYTQLCQTYGGLPIMTKPNELGDDFSTIIRATFEQTVDFIVEDCDAAAALLPLKSNSEMGRATKEAALSIKARILLFAASDLTADGTVVNELVGYISPNRTALWTAARDAAKAVIDLGTCQLENFGAPDQKAVADNYWKFFGATYDLSSPEVIWGIMYRLDLGTIQRRNIFDGPNGNTCWGSNGPFQGMVDEYEMEDGSKYSDHYTVDANKYIKNISVKYLNESPYHNREPRFYASILFDSALFQPRLSNLIARDPLGIYERRQHKTIASDGKITNDYGLDTRNATFFPNGGGYGGYLTKKFMDPKVIGVTGNNENVAIAIRYAEILLIYAEACMELGDITTAETYINMIRHRVALPNFTGDINEALRHERKVELYAEGFRWFDIRRWKIMPQVFVPRGDGVDIIETHNVATGQTTTTWQIINAQVANKWVDSMYWIPIQTVELKKAPQLIQNPGY